MKNSGLTGAFRRQERLFSGIVLCLLIFGVWSWVYGRTSLVAWQTPLGYGGDAWLVLGFAKAFMDGDIFPVLHKWVVHLNAPFSANWNDYPMTEECIFAIMGWLGRAVGLFSAANFIVMLAHLLAGLSFWYVGRELKYRPAFAFTGALLFAFSPYSFARNLGHIPLTYYWHVPLMLLVTWWAYSAEPMQVKSRKWFTAIAIAAISGALNPYYTGMFLQFLGFTVLLHLARKQYLLIRFPLFLIGVTVASFLIMNADTLSYSLFHGANHQAVSRNFASLELYALKIPDLVFPPSYHSWHGWADYGQRHYFLPSMIKGEIGSPYLGLVGLVGLTWLVGTGLYRLLQGSPQLIPLHAWQVLWVLLYSLVGGINLLLGTFGLILFRGTNRYSIFILTILLLFLVRQLSRKCPGKMVMLVALGITVIGLWDQLPPKASAAQIHKTADFVQSDRNLAEQLESQLPKNSMVFQLPVVAFPEMPPVYQMADYEHFRPYLFTQHIHYSYGTNKGRGDADWQSELSKLAPADMATKLETYGFGAIMINRKGYEDKGARLIRELLNTNRAVLMDNGELVAIRLKPAAAPIFPEALIPVTRAVQLNVFKQEITTSAPLQTLKANETATMQVRVRNIGNEPWPSKGIDEKGTNRVGLGFYWIDSSGKEILPGRALLPYDLMPGSSAGLDVKIQAPSQVGDYTLRFSMVQEHVAWFNDKGAAPFTVKIKVKSK